MQGFTWKCSDQKTGAQLATVVGGGWEGEQRSKSSLAGPAGEIKNGSCPVADLFKACADVLSPPPTHTSPWWSTHPHTHWNTFSPQTLSCPCNQNKALRWHFLSQEHSLALWIGVCGISSPLQYIFLVLHPSPLVLRRLTNGIGCPLTPSMVWFLNDLSMEMSLTLSIQCCPPVQACFQKEN